MATQMQLKVGRKSHGRQDFKKEKTKTVRVFFGVIFWCLHKYGWITEKELERVIENKGDEFRRKKKMQIQSGGEKMRSASGQKAAASKVKMSSSEK